MKLKIQTFFFILLCNISISQNKQIMFGFNEVPQSLMINPGTEVAFKKHIGFPLLSGISANVSSNMITLNDLFANNGVNISDKIDNLVFSLNSNDHVIINQQLELINIGYRLKNNKNYLSFGLYEELDLISYYPKDPALLFYQGNADSNGDVELNRPYNLNDINFKGDLVSVLHIGISRKVNKKLTAGIRAKLYSGAFHVESKNNKGTFTTVGGVNNTYQHQFSNVDFTLRSSGVFENTNSDKNLVRNVLKKMILNSNFGLGFDVGFTYNLKNDIVVSGSVLDIGFINYNNNVKNYQLKGDYNLNGLDLLRPIDPANPDFDAWGQLTDEFDTQLNNEENSRGYVTLRPIKLNASIGYEFGETVLKQKKSTSVNCAAFVQSKIERKNRVGLQLYSVFRAKQPQVAVSGFYYRKLLKSLSAKLTYTADPYSFKNIGVGLSTNLGNVHFYGALDNILSYSDISKSNTMSVQFGINWILE